MGAGNNCPIAYQPHHWMKSTEKAEQDSFVSFIFFHTAFKNKTITLKSESEAVCSARRRERQDDGSLSTLIRSNENYLTERARKH